MPDKTKLSSKEGKESTPFTIIFLKYGNVTHRKRKKGGIVAPNKSNSESKLK